MKPKVFVIVLNWNGGGVTLSCLQSLRKIYYENYRVVLVDNASTDGSAERVEQCFPEVLVIKNKRNVGFDSGNNIGMRMALDAGADAVFLLNNDTVVDPNVLQVLTEADASLPRAGILGPKIYYFDEPRRVWWAGCQRTYSLTGWLMNYTQEGKGQLDGPQFGEVKRVDSVIGCAMYIKREVLEEIGMLDQRFFIYHEEHDFCARAAMAGWCCYFVPEAKVWHKVSLSMGGEYSPSLHYLWTRNWLLLSRKQTSVLLWPVVYAAYLRESYWLYQGFMKRGMQEPAKAVLAGAWNALLNRFGNMERLEPPGWLSRLAAWDCKRKIARRG